MTDGAMQNLSVRQGGVCGVFLDPPYNKGLGERSVASCLEGNWLAPGAAHERNQPDGRQCRRSARHAVIAIAHGEDRRDGGPPRQQNQPPYVARLARAALP